MKARKRLKPSHVLQNERRRGRRPKADHERILDEHGLLIAQELRVHPLRQPIDTQFAPYYDRILNGELRGIYDYWDRNAPRLEPSFYELLGFLVTIRFYSVANQVLSVIERGDMGRPSKRDVYAYWYNDLKPRCETARPFVEISTKVRGQREMVSARNSFP